MKKKQEKRNINPVNIKCVNDIRKAIIPFTIDAKDGSIQVNSTVEWEEEGQKNEAKVSAPSNDVSMRKMLLDGFKQVEQRKKMLDRLHQVLEDEYAPTLPEADIDSIPMSVDRIIKDRLGGRREGFKVVWDIDNRRVVFDPYTKELSENDE